MMNSGKKKKEEIPEIPEEEIIEPSIKMTIPIKSIPINFSKGASKDTGFNDEGNGNVIYLDRHTVNCDNAGISRFHLNRDYKGKYRYDYTCSSRGDLGKSLEKDTGFNEDGNGNMIYLDRHTIDCGSNSILSRFQLTRDGGKKIRYNYKCISSNKPLTCRNVTGEGHDDGNESTVYLDRHDIKCQDDEVLNYLKLNRPTQKTVSYNYKCCKY